MRSEARMRIRSSFQMKPTRSYFFLITNTVSREVNDSDSNKRVLGISISDYI
jgi:hypothetical protein